MTEVQNKPEESKMPTAECIPCDRSRILIVDDEETVRRTFRLVLSHEFPDCIIDLAVNGTEAASKFSSAHYGTLLMDLRMPGMDGYTSFCEIQRICHAKNWEMPSVIFCTGYDPPNGVQDLVAENPAHCLLHKPISREDILDALKGRLTFSRQ